MSRRAYADHSTLSHRHVAVVDALHLDIEVGTLLPVVYVPSALLFLLFPFGIRVEEALYLLWRRRVGIMDLDLDVDLLRRKGSLQEARGVGLVGVTVLLIRTDGEVIPA